MARIPCDFPARLLSHGGYIPATVRDLSRMGVRLGLSPDTLGASAGTSIGTLARHLARLLPEEPTIQLHHRLLGVLVLRRIRIVRVRPATGRPPLVELGCLFSEPLDDDESVALGLALPAAGETPSDARRRLNPQPPHPRLPELSTEPTTDRENLFFGDLGTPDDAA